MRRRQIPLGRAAAGEANAAGIGQAAAQKNNGNKQDWGVKSNKNKPGKGGKSNKQDMCDKPRRNISMTRAANPIRISKACASNPRGISNARAPDPAAARRGWGSKCSRRWPGSGAKNNENK